MDILTLRAPRTQYPNLKIANEPGWGRWTDFASQRGTEIDSCSSGVEFEIQSRELPVENRENLAQQLRRETIWISRLSP